MSNDNVIALVIGFVIGAFVAIFVFAFVMIADDAALNDISIQCGLLGYDKAFQSNNIYYCAHELERIDE